MPLLANSPVSQDAYQQESEGIHGRFEQSRNGQAAVWERSNLTDSLIRELWNQSPAGSAGPDRICVAALGGYGRRALFPCSMSMCFSCMKPPSAKPRKSRRFHACARRSGICIFASAPQPDPWRSAASFIATTLNSIFRCSIADSSVAMQTCLSSFDPRNSENGGSGGA